MIQPIHTKVPGRARFKVDGLYRSHAVKALLESRLAEDPHVTGVSANPLTANVLVIFHADADARDVAALIEGLLGPETAAGKAHGRERPPETENAALPSAARLAKQAPEALNQAREKLKQILSAREPQPRAAWHRMEGDEVLSVLQSREDLGLSSETAVTRLKRYGPNTLPESSPRSWWRIFAGQFLSLPVALLGAAAGISLLTGGVLDAVIIGGVVVANALIGVKTESEAEKTIQSLQKVVTPTARVVRDNEVIDISAESVVAGDILLLKPGAYVAADSRLLQCTHLSIDESSLTGESMPVSKRSLPAKLENIPLADRKNMAYMGTLVTGGEGRAVVVATGQFTEIGGLQLLMDQTASPETPIERNLRVMGDQLVLVSGGICGMVFLMGFLRGYGFLQMLRMGISLAAAAVPEGLPAAATINFALGINKMKRHSVLIRRLQAVETLGAVQTVCMDKTGTLTLNRMSVVRLYAGDQYVQVSNGGFRRDDGPVDILGQPELSELARVCVLCNESRVNGGNGGGAFKLSGSPTENALIEFAVRAGIDVNATRRELKLQKVNYRSESRLYMTTLHRGPGNSRYLAVKGNPREVLDLCRWRVNGGKRVSLTESEKSDIETRNEHMAGDALRVLGVAYASSDNGDAASEESGLTWLGLVGMADPVREGVKPLINAFHHAGIKTVMITGDQSPTAYAVARELNLGRENPLGILDSIEFSSVDPELMAALAKKVHVYSRVSPAHKLQIVRALQEAGMTVAMTGDGINDGPALKAADLGIAMGHSGTDVAREVADVVLENDDLEALIIAVSEGRATYTNIRKSVHFFLSTNMSEIMVMFAATAAGMGFPLNVMQLLWINIISDIFPGLALSMEAPEPDILDQPPREAAAPLFSRSDFKRMLFESGVISGAAMGAYGYGILRYGIGPGATSLAFQSLTFAQLLHALSCRSERHRLYDRERLKPNRYLDLAVGGSLALQVLTMAVPGLRRILGLAPPSLTDMGVIAGSALLPLAVNELTKEQSGNEK